MRLLLRYHRPTMDATGATLMAMYAAMRSHFGAQNWWPASPELPEPLRKLEICVGAVLTQNTSWRNVERAVARLIEAGCMDVTVLAEMPTELLAERIRPAGYYNVKARRLKNFIDAVCAGGGGISTFLNRRTDVLREELLAVNGIGPETADSILLYAAGKCSFVVDAYTRRALARHGLAEPDADYEEVKALFESHVPARVGLYNDFHAQWVAVGKTYCRPRARCQGCPLAVFPHDASAA